MALVAGLTAVSAAWAQKTSNTDVVIAVPDTYVREDADSSFIRATLEHLNTVVKGRVFRLQMLPVADLTTQLKLIRPDFLLAPSGLEVYLDEPIANFRLATRKSPLAQDASQSLGSVIVTLRDRNDIQTLADLQGKKIAGGLEGSIGMWLAAMNEVENAGFDSRAFFKETVHLFDVYPEIVSTLWGGEVDAAVLPTCALETLSQLGLMDMNEVKVIHDKTDERLACVRSTELFPDFGFVGFDWTDKDLARLVTVGVLTYDNPDDVYRWEPFVSHDQLNGLYRNLKIGPFSHLRDVSLSAIYQRHPTAFHFAGLVLLLIIFHGLALQILVHRKTADLRHALKRQKEAEVEAKKQSRLLGHLERRNVVNQMSGMIAHEIKSPVGAICNFAAVLGFVLPEEVRRNEDVSMAITGISSEANRIAGIVDRVRSYAKSQKMAHVECDLVAIARKAIRAMRLTTDQIKIKENYRTVAAVVKGDPLELELLILNLLRNASEVTPAEGDNRIEVTIAATEDNRWQIRVSDRGQRLDDAAFARLTQMMESVKPEGLGMGLSIIRGIADSHAATLEFVRNRTAGLTARVTFAPLTGEHKKEGV